MPSTDSDLYPETDSGELIVQNGRQSGTRKPLRSPLTLVGRSPSCDVRLNVDGVDPMHCLLVLGPDGLVVRDLDGKNDTLVNGKPISSCTLKEGDLLTIGPFHFRVRPPRSRVSPFAKEFLYQEMERLQAEKEALRIQAAAVVAQQTGLIEQENRLEQRRLGLERQEEQLGGHLEVKRAKLVELQQQVREARAALHEEREAYDRERTETLGQLTLARREAETVRRRTSEERRRLTILRRRLKRRWRQQLDQERQALREREDRLASQTCDLEAGVERLEQQRDALHHQRLRFNGEQEMGRRQLQAGWRLLKDQQQQAEALRQRDEAELRRQRHELARQAAAVVRAQQEIERQRREWQEARFALERELEGLNARVRNHRCKVVEHEQELARLGPLPAGLMPEHHGANGANEIIVVDRHQPGSDEGALIEDPRDTFMREGLGMVERLASELAEQRVQLVQQMEHLLCAEQGWQQERQAMLEEIEDTVLRLAEREETVEGRERAVAEAECQLRERLELARHQRQQLTGWQSRLAARELALKGERQKLLARLEGGEQAVQRQLTVLGELRQRWVKRWRQKIGELQAELERGLDYRQQHFKVWEEYLNRHAALEQEQRAVTERSLALEQYRAELFGKADNQADAQRRVDRLSRRWAAQGEAAQRALEKEREALEAEIARIEGHGRELLEARAALDRREEELAEREANWEQERALQEKAQAQLQAELEYMQNQHQLALEQSAAANAELERLALSLLEDQPPEPPAQVLPLAA